MATIEELKRLEQSQVALRFAERRDNAGAAVAISKIDKYTGDDPVLRGYMAYLESEIARDPRNAVGAAKIFSGIYQETLGKLNVNEIPTYYGSILESLSDDQKTKITGFFGAENLGGRTLDSINDELLDANTILRKSTSTDEEKQAANEALQKYQTFMTAKDILEDAYLTELSVDTGRQARKNDLEALANSL